MFTPDRATTALQADEGPDPRRLLDCVIDSIIVLDAAGRISFANAAARRAVAGGGQVSGPAAGLVHPEDRERVLGELAHIIASRGSPMSSTFRIRHVDGWLLVEAIATNLLGEPGVDGVVVCFRDLSGEQRGANARTQLAAALAVTGDLLTIHSPDGALIEANRAARDFFGLSEPLGTSSAAALYPSEVLAEWPTSGSDAAAPLTLETTVVAADGRFVDVGVSITPSFGDDGELSAVAVLAQDISDRRFFESVLAHRAMHDPLTGLANSGALLERIAAELERPNRSPGELAVVYIDLDNFKLVNDSLGHDRGDQLLLAITSRLRSTVRSGDLLARIGADEFVAVLPMPDGLTRARAVAERVTRIVSVPIQIDSRKVYVAASVGISIDDDPTDRTPATLLRNAELAMHEAKQRGRNRVEVFDSSLRKAARARLELETELHQAIERGELAVAYQPVFDLTDRGLTGFEALVRWRHPLRGELTPADFVDVASESSLISETDSVVLELACADLAAWTERFGRRRELGVAVNVSPRQLAREDLPELIAETIRRHGLAPEQLTLEIIEGQLMADVPATLATLDRLRALGIGLAIDDFGTGHSSLGYLRQFDVDVLKIDKSFVATLGTDDTSHVIIEAMVQLADTFGYATVAEGVEEQVQLDALAEMGCRRAQGFLLGRPLPADEVADFLEQSLAVR